MKADRIIKNAKVFTSDQNNLLASALAVKAGKDADFLVFDKDLLTAEHEGFSYNLPSDVYFCSLRNQSCPIVFSIIISGERLSVFK